MDAKTSKLLDELGYEQNVIKEMLVDHHDILEVKAMDIACDVIDLICQGMIVSDKHKKAYYKLI